MDTTSSPNARLCFTEARGIDSLQNRIDRGATLYGTTAANKNPHAVALGRMTSPAKAESSAKNAKKVADRRGAETANAIEPGTAQVLDRPAPPRFSWPLIGIGCRQ